VRNTSVGLYHDGTRMNPAVMHARTATARVVRFSGYDGYKYYTEDGGFLLIRFSGTEPIVRVYTETTRQDLVPAILDAGLEIAGLKE
jgi:phosphomannomutase